MALVYLIQSEPCDLVQLVSRVEVLVVGLAVQRLVELVFYLQRQERRVNKIIPDLLLLNPLQQHLLFLVVHHELHVIHEELVLYRVLNDILMILLVQEHPSFSRS